MVPQPLLEAPEKPCIAALDAELVTADSRFFTVDPSEEQEGIAFQHAGMMRGKNADVKAADFPLPAQMPLGHFGMMSAEWSEADFQERIKRRLGEIGKSAAGALADKGYSVDLIRQRAKDGRRMDTILKIVDALDWDLAEAIGIKPAAASIDVKLLGSALWAVDQVLPRRIEGGDRTAVLLRGAALFYKVLAEAQARGEPISNDKEILAHARTLAAATGF